MALGQGGINMWGQTNWVMDHCDVWGFADGSQVVGPGKIVDCWFHDLTVGRMPSGMMSHNDGCQNYGGQVTVERSVYDMQGTAGSTNGALFCSKPVASFVANELFADATRPDVNIIHAWDSTAGIVINSGRVSRMGRVIGKVTMGKDVVRD
jgi:hypothetical protein